MATTNSYNIISYSGKLEIALKKTLRKEYLRVFGVLKN
jgi:hypothetical protein